MNGSDDEEEEIKWPWELRSRRRTNYADRCCSKSSDDSHITMEMTPQEKSPGGKLNYRKQARNGMYLPCGGDIVFWFEVKRVVSGKYMDGQWWDNTDPIIVLQFRPYSMYTGECCIKYRKSMYNRCYYRRFGYDPNNCNWSSSGEDLLAMPDFSGTCTRAEEATDDIVLWVKMEDELKSGDNDVVHSDDYHHNQSDDSAQSGEGKESFGSDELSSASPWEEEDGEYDSDLDESDDDESSDDGSDHSGVNIGVGGGMSGSDPGDGHNQAEALESGGGRDMEQDGNAEVLSYEEEYGRSTAEGCDENRDGVVGIGVASRSSSMSGLF